MSTNRDTKSRPARRGTAGRRTAEIRTTGSQRGRSVGKGKASKGRPRKLGKHRKPGIKNVIAAIFFTALIASLEFCVKLIDYIKRTAPKRIYYIVSISAAIILTLTTVTVVWLMTNINAQKVFLDGTLIGVIGNKTITADEIYEQAKLKLVTELGVSVQINETVTTELVHANKTDEIEYVVGAIYKRFTYTVLAAVIVVDDVDMAIVKSSMDAQSLLGDILDDHLQEGLNIYSRDFVERVETVERYVETADIMTNDNATEVLLANKQEEVLYEVKDGDALWNIAVANGMTVDEIFAMNPELNEDATKLRIGTKIKVSRSVPMLSVITKERIEQTETVKLPPETVYNDSEPKTYSKVVRQGSDGEDLVVYDIIRINKMEEERVEVSRNTVREAVAQVTEIGTK